jgi:hypothetical protein
VTRRLARTLMACWATLPAGAIATIVTGDLRWLGIGLVLFASATAWGLVTLEAAKLRTKAEAAATAKIKAESRKFLDDLAAGRFHQDDAQ